MKIIIDTEEKNLTTIDGNSEKRYDLYSKKSFEILSKEWLRLGWNQKYTYTFSWLGRPIIQLPDDMIRTQEAIFQIKPDVIIETGVAHGGSLIFYSSLCKAMDKGRVIGIDIEIRPHNRKAIEEHPLSDRITLFEGSSTEKNIIEAVKSTINPDDVVMVILDSNHSYQHVYNELEAYSELVTTGSYIVATDGVMKDLTDVPRGMTEWANDNPSNAAVDFAKAHESFLISPPTWPFNESELDENITHWPNAWLKKIK